MRPTAKTLFVILFSLFYLLPNVVFAESFWENLSYNITPGVGIKNVEASLYGSRATAQWNDINGDNDLDDSETLTGTIKLYDRNGTLVLESPNNLNSDEIEAWATKKSELILSTIFPGGVSGGTGVSDDATMARVNFSANVLKKLKTAKQVQGSDRINSEFRGALEYEDLDINGDSGQSFSFVTGTATEMDSGLEIGFLVPYRYTDMDDEIDSESHYLGLNLYLKKQVAEVKNFEISIGADIFGSIFFLQSDALEYSGNLKYGGGIFTSCVRELSFGTLSFGLDYKLSKAYLPDSLISDDDDSDGDFVQKAIDYVNDLDPVSTISYGFNYGFPIVKDIAVMNIEVVRSNFISSDILSERDSQTVAAVSVSYCPSETFELNLGVRNTFELEDIDIWGVTLGVIHRF